MREQQHTQRHGQQRGYAHRHDHQHQVFPDQTPQVVAHQALPQLGAIRRVGLGGPLHCGGLAARQRLGGVLRQKLLRDAGEGLALQLGLRIHRDHAGLVDAALQPTQRGPRGGVFLRQVQPVQQHGVVARKVALVVLQHQQAEMVDLGIGGVDVHHVDLLLRDGIVGQAVVQAYRCATQLVTRGQALPAIGAADEFVGQAQLQGRVPGQIAQRADAQLLGLRPPHGQRIAVVEAQRHSHTQAQRRQRVVHVGQAHAGVALDDLQRDGAAVFGVQVNLPRAQRLVDDGGVAQALQHAGLGACGLRRLGDDLGQDVGLGEAFGADFDLRLLRLRPDGQQQHKAGSQRL